MYSSAIQLKNIVIGNQEFAKRQKNIFRFEFVGRAHPEPGGFTVEASLSEVYDFK